MYISHGIGASHYYFPYARDNVTMPGIGGAEERLNSNQTNGHY
ncbi:MAG TPA: hypothetical protein VFJ51_12410 [Nitrososphaeraceae archaeon]|nr:hypothetical protein [Nitrososphaeraceae archaeon]